MKNDITDYIASQPESDDPDYLVWKDTKVKAALAKARAKPEDRVPQDEIWSYFSREY